MEKARSLFRTSVLALAVLAALAVPAVGQDPFDKAVMNAKPVSWLLVTQTFYGTMGQTDAFLATFMNEITAQRLGPSLVGPEVKPLEILHDNPDEMGTIDIELAFPIRPGVTVAPPLVLRPLSFPKAVFYTHQGDYSQLSGVHARIDRSVQNVAPTYRTAWPVVLRLLTDPRAVSSPTLIKTEMIVPLEN